MHRGFKIDNLRIFISDKVLIFSLFLTLPLFFYKLGQSSLVSWDEAWYGDISRHILKTGDFLNLVYNGAPYTDHPPGVFWFEALSFKFLGINEFSARLPSAIAGFLGVIAIYFLGKELFNKTVGYVSAVALTSAIWFLFRARAGDLDTPLTLFFILTVYLALKTVKHKKFLLPFFLSFTFLTLIKAALPFTIIPALFVIFWGNKQIKAKDYILGTLFLVFVFGSWLLLQEIRDPALVAWHISHGMRGVGQKTDYVQNFLKMKEYLHNGIGKWFWPGFFGLFIGLFFRQRRFLILFVLFVSYFTPFIFSSQGHIWHLIPLFPFMILAFFGSFYLILDKLIKHKLIVTLIILGFGFYIGLGQIKRDWYQFIDIPAYVSDEAILSREASKYPERLYIDGDFDPAAAFYSDKVVNKIFEGNLKGMFDAKEPFLIITGKWRIDQAKLSYDKYKILKADRDKVLVLHI